jgi:nucleoside-diphosphate-sugar epimerase/phosphohistidine swiveling domain-containing protein
MRIAVTGASGVFGRGIAARLRSYGHDVVGLARHRPESWPAGSDFVEADIRDTAGVRRVVEAADVVAHCAWVVNSTPDEKFTRDVNIGGSENMLAEMDRAGSRRIVFASSVLAYGSRPANTPPLTEDDPLTPAPEHFYGFHKAHVERLLADSGKEWVSIRPGIVVGRAADNIVLRLMASPAFPNVNGSADRALQIVHTDDVHRFFVRAVLGSEVGAVNLAASGEPTMRQITAAIGRRMVPVNKRILDVGLGALYRRELVEASPAELDLLLNFPVMDTSWLTTEWQYQPAWSAQECLDDFALAVRGRVSLGKKVFTVPWRIGMVTDVPSGDSLSSDGLTPEPAGPDANNGEFDTPVDPRFPTYVASNLSEALPGPFSPSSASATVRGLRAGGASIAERLRLRGAARREMGARSVGIFGHRLYAGVTAVYYMAEAMPGTNPDSLIEQFFGRILGDTPVFGDERPPIHYGSLGERLSDLIGVGLTGAGLLAWSGRESRDYVADVVRLESLVPEDVRTLDHGRLDSLILLARDLVVHGWVLAAWAGLLCTATATAAERSHGSGRAVADGIVSGRALESLRRLTAAARKDPAAVEALTQSEDVLAVVARQAPDFHAVLLRELALVGHRGPAECELRSSTYGDKPEVFARMIAKSLAQYNVSIPAVGDRESADLKRPSAVQKLAAWQLREREIRRDKVVRSTWLLRSLLRERGRRLVDQQVLADVDDVFYLLIDELEALPPNVTDLVARRRQDQKMLADILPPSAFSGRWTPDADTSATQSDEILQGVGVCGGRVRGKVRIVNERTIDDLLPGEVLVAEVTDVGYTPAFEFAGAVVTNLGGLMSHAAIVAREFGVTCVVDARDATRRLANGDLVEVDGAAGTVSVLERSENAIDRVAKASSQSGK